MCTFCIFHNSELWRTLHILRFYFVKQLCYIYLYFVFLNKQRVLMFINCNIYQNISRMTLKSLSCSWWYRAVDAFCTYRVLLCLTVFYFLKIHFLLLLFFSIFPPKIVFNHLIEHTSKIFSCKKPKMAKMSHTASFFCGAETQTHPHPSIANHTLTRTTQTPNKKSHCPGRFCEILASMYGQWPYSPGPFITLKNILSQICSRTIFEKYTAPEAYN